MEKSIMVDMDDVICEGGFLYLINEYLGTNYEKSYFKNFYMQDIIPDDCKNDFWKWFITKNQYNYCELLDGAYDTLKDINKYYKLYIGTSYIFRDIPYDCGHILSQKYDYLVKALPFISPSSYVFLTDKSALQTDIKIDDRIDNLENTSRKILFTAFHNQNIDNDTLCTMGIERADNWHDVRKKLIRKR